jgi:hypothetical protein
MTKLIDRADKIIRYFIDGNHPIISIYDSTANCDLPLTTLRHRDEFNRYLIAHPPNESVGRTNYNAHPCAVRSNNKNCGKNRFMFLLKKTYVNIETGITEQKEIYHCRGCSIEVLGYEFIEAVRRMYATLTSNITYRRYINRDSLVGTRPRDKEDKQDTPKVKTKVIFEEDKPDMTQQQFNQIVDFTELVKDLINENAKLRARIEELESTDNTAELKAKIVKLQSMIQKMTE